MGTWKYLHVSQEGSYGPRPCLGSFDLTDLLERGCKTGLSAFPLRNQTTASGQQSQRQTLRMAPTTATEMHGVHKLKQCAAQCGRQVPHSTMAARFSLLRAPVRSLFWLPQTRCLGSTPLLLAGVGERLRKWCVAASHSTMAAA